MSDFDTPCYVISSNGFRDSVSYEDGWCFGPSEHIGNAADDEAARALIKSHIRAKLSERNALPLYWISDHGNINRRRRIRLRTTRPGCAIPRPAPRCAWFAGCSRLATGTTPHPVLGAVPTCDHCHAFATSKT